MKVIRKLTAVFLTAALFSLPLVAESSSESAFAAGCKAYAAGDWTSAVFSLKKAASFEQNNNPDTFYMLINAEIYSGDYESALEDCVYYQEEFKGSLYESNVVYLKGRCYFSLGEYDKAVITLSDFCHQYEKHDMYAAGLFWIGESFYACYQYPEAAALYQRVVTEFPDDAKAPACQYRIETINQREREEKLLYLLKQTGEEYLFAKEEYEKQLKFYSTETASGTRAKLIEAQKRNAELEEKYKELELELQRIKASGGIDVPDEKKSEGLPEVDVKNTDESLLEVLKAKADETKYLLEEKASQKK